MKVWKCAKFLKKDKNIDMITKSYINYIYKYGPINDLIRKYNISPNDIYKLNQYTANRIAGLIILYLANDKKRLNDIVLKYNTNDLLVSEVTPEIEGYIERWGVIMEIKKVTTNYNKKKVKKNTNYLANSKRIKDTKVFK